MSDSTAETGFTVQPATIDQMAGAVALTLGALGSLLLVIWQSRCLCRCRIGVSDKCYLFDCSREPPPLERVHEPMYLNEGVAAYKTCKRSFLY